MITMQVRKSVKCNGDYSVFIKFPYDINIVNLVRQQPTRYWNTDTKEWELPSNTLNKLKTVFSEYEVKILDTDLLEPKKIDTLLPKSFEYKTTPFNHQIVGVDFGMSHTRWLLGDEQGLGKTKQVIDIAVAHKLKYGYSHCLIVCGVNSLKWNWLNEIHTHSNEHGYILGQRIKHNKLTIGSTKDKLSDLESIEDNSSYFLITNVETLRDTQIALKLSQLCSQHVINFVAIDEIHKCKNPSSQQGKGILKLDAERKIAMTGTPLMNTPLDLFIILKWLGYEKHAFYSFKNHYCVMGGYGGYEVVGYKNLEELQTQLNDIMLRRLKDDVLDLPEKLLVDEYVEMTPKQAEIYKEVRAELQTNIDKIAMSNNPLAETIRLRQTTGYTGILSSIVHESAKLDRLEELVEEATSSNQKVVVFSNWTSMTDAIVDRLNQNYNVLCITGATRDEDRQRIVNDFQNENGSEVIVGTIGAMGTGLTLTAGTVVIFVDEPWTMAAKNQAIDRCHRIGTTKNITVYTLLCKNTIDERIHEIVENKGVMSDILVDGKIVGDKLQLVEYLLS